MTTTTEHATHWERWTPRSSTTTNLFIAGMIWLGVGTGLTTAGATWLFGSVTLILGLILAVAAAGVGAAKYTFVIRKTGRRAAARIEARGDGKCVGGLFSRGTWIMVVGMMALGAILRRLPIPLWALGMLYLAVGVALFSGSFVYFSAWRARRQRSEA